MGSVAAVRTVFWTNGPFKMCCMFRRCVQMCVCVCERVLRPLDPQVSEPLVVLILGPWLTSTGCQCSIFQTQSQPSTAPPPGSRCPVSALWPLTGLQQSSLHDQPHFSCLEKPRHGGAGTCQSLPASLGPLLPDPLGGGVHGLSGHRQLLGPTPGHRQPEARSSKVTWWY